MRKVCVLLVFLFATGALQASSFLFTASSSTACGSGDLCGTALFTVTGPNAFSVTLSNTLLSIDNAGQLLTDLEFTLTASPVTLSGSNGAFVNIAGSGAPTSAGTGATGWGFGSNGGANNWLLCVICGHGVTAGATPSQGIIDYQTSYASANGSIAGNGPHNPFLESGAIFNFTTSATLPTSGSADPFSNVTISFGTTFGNDVVASSDDGGGGGAGEDAPEPVSLMLAGGGLIGLAMLKRRRRQ